MREYEWTEIYEEPALQEHNWAEEDAERVRREREEAVIRDAILNRRNTPLPVEKKLWN